MCSTGVYIPPRWFSTLWECKSVIIGNTRVAESDERRWLVQYGKARLLYQYRVGTAPLETRVGVGVSDVSCWMVGARVTRATERTGDCVARRRLLQWQAWESRDNSWLLWHQWLHCSVTQWWEVWTWLRDNWQLYNSRWWWHNSDENETKWSNHQNLCIHSALMFELVMLCYKRFSWNFCTTESRSRIQSWPGPLNDKIWWFQTLKIILWFNPYGHWLILRITVIVQRNPIVLLLILSWWSWQKFNFSLLLETVKTMPSQHQPLTTNLSMKHRAQLYQRK